MEWVNHGPTAQLNHVITTCIYSEIACWFHLVWWCHSKPSPEPTNLVTSSNILRCYPLLLTHTSLVWHFTGFHLHYTISISQKCLRQYKGRVQFSEGSETLERWDSFHPGTRKLTPSSVLFPKHMPISLGNYQRTVNEAHILSVSTRTWRSLWKQRQIDPLKGTTCFFYIMHFVKEPS